MDGSTAEGRGRWKGTQVLAVIGLIVGIVLGIVLNPSIPVWLQPYLPIMIVAALDALFGACRSYLSHTFSDRVFVVSFLSNVAIAALIVWMGDQIGVGSQLSTAVVVVLGIRIFTNAAAIRRAVLHA
jgi:small basic protein